MPVQFSRRCTKPVAFIRCSVCANNMGRVGLLLALQRIVNAEQSSELVSNFTSLLLAFWLANPCLEIKGRAALSAFAYLQELTSRPKKKCPQCNPRASSQATCGCLRFGLLCAFEKACPCSLSDPDPRPSNISCDRPTISCPCQRYHFCTHQTVLCFNAVPCSSLGSYGALRSLPQ